MLSPADAALVARDPALPDLALLLDDDALAALLGAPARRRYLRYKPGTSCVLAAVVGGQDVAVTVAAEDGTAKLDKTVARAPAGSVLLQRPGLLVTTPTADRDLPGLARLQDTVDRLGLPRGPVRRLSWKPARRYVGRLGDDVVVRLFRTLPDLPTGLPGVAPVLAQHHRLAARAMRFVPGQPLDVLLRQGPAEALLRRTGEVLATLHASSVPGLTGEQADLAGAAEQVGVLLPDLADRAAALAAALQMTQDDTAVLHGDWSADQVVVDGDRVVLVDLDRVRRGAPADDLGSWRASAVLTGLPPSAEARLYEGYATVRPVPTLEEVAGQAAAHLLRRAAEPFRTARPQWERETRAVLATAEAQLAAAT